MCLREQLNVGMRAGWRTRGGRSADFGGRGPQRSLASLGGRGRALSDQDGCWRAAMDGMGHQIATERLTTCGQVHMMSGRGRAGGKQMKADGHAVNVASHPQTLLGDPSVRSSKIRQLVTSVEIDAFLQSGTWARRFFPKCSVQRAGEKCGRNEKM